MPSSRRKKTSTTSVTRHPTYERIYAAVRRIPRGRVATYGQIAAIARASGPRQVGYALHSLPENARVPWHRVVNAQGRVSPRAMGGSDDMQRVRLEIEGVTFDDRDRIAMDRYQWDGE